MVRPLHQLAILHSVLLENTVAYLSDNLAVGLTGNQHVVARIHLFYPY